MGGCSAKVDPALSRDCFLANYSGPPFVHPRPLGLDIKLDPAHNELASRARPRLTGNRDPAFRRGSHCQVERVAALCASQLQRGKQQ